MLNIREKSALTFIETATHRQKTPLLLKGLAIHAHARHYLN